MQRFFDKIFSRHKERIEVMIETNELWEITVLQKTKIKHCENCGIETVFVSSDLAQQIVGSNPKKIADLIISGDLHSRNSSESKHLICLQSLKTEFKK